MQVKSLSRLPWQVWLIAVLILIGAGLAVGWWLYGPEPPVQETYAASAVQADGSLILERKPDADAKPAMRVPKGAKVERVAKVIAQAGLIPATASEPARCPPVTVDLALVRLPDQTRRVIASSPDGQIVGGVDIPVENAVVHDPSKWAAGLSYDSNRKAGIWLDRDIGPFRTGVAVRQGDAGGVRGELRAGIRF